MANYGNPQKSGKSLLPTILIVLAIAALAWWVVLPVLGWALGIVGTLLTWAAVAAVGAGVVHFGLRASGRQGLIPSKGRKMLDRR